MYTKNIIDFLFLYYMEELKTRFLIDFIIIYYILYILFYTIYKIFLLE